jgi:hypothetical protein
MTETGEDRADVEEEVEARARLQVRFAERVLGVRAHTLAQHGPVRDTAGDNEKPCGRVVGRPALRKEPYDCFLCDVFRVGEARAPATRIRRVSSSSE